MIFFNDIQLNESELSEDTIKWLNQYNMLSEDDKKTISYVPNELLIKSGILNSDNVDEAAIVD